MVAARDVIELNKAKKMYGAYKAMLCQYNNAFSIHQLTRAVMKMEESNNNEALVEFNTSN